ncbi:type 4a pilus biogenesis protein PilO [Thiotrichales bacterium 19S3-7]|nr:type 4a pilus biogenesis protein PilO [Thiotrichales bacterium 19S3-7]MCF6800785.1 type 4a pilus biogenesis protein PilO [Thiotrichales bacterium 19S3-11]
MIDRLMQLSIRLDKIVNLGRYVRLAIYFIVFVICMAIGYGLFITHRIEQLHSIEKQQQIYKEKIAQKLIVLAKAKQYKQQINQLQQRFNVMLKKLPNDNEVPSLIEEMTEEAFSAGLEFHLIKPLALEDKGFYKALPIEIVVEGTYNQIGRFVNSIASMSRIITIEDFTLKRANDNQHLILAVNAMTYQYGNQLPQAKKEGQAYD